MGFCKDSGGWRISMGDSYKGHKAFWREHHEDLFKKKVFPYRILGGLTPDLAPLDREDNKMFKSHSKDHQHRFEAAKFEENPKAIPPATRMDILERVAYATQKTAEGSKPINVGMHFCCACQLFRYLIKCQLLVGLGWEGEGVLYLTWRVKATNDGGLNPKPNPVCNKEIEVQAVQERGGF